MTATYDLGFTAVTHGAQVAGLLGLTEGPRRSRWGWRGVGVIRLWKEGCSIYNSWQVHCSEILNSGVICDCDHIK